MIDILEEARAQKTFSSTTFTIKKDDFPSPAASPEQSSSVGSMEQTLVSKFRLEESSESLLESRSAESVEQTLVSQFRLDLSDTSSSIDGDALSWFQLIQ